MYWGILSDSHGNHPSTERAADVLSQYEIHLVLHCGDIGTPSVLDVFRKWKLHYVLGNIDIDPESFHYSDAESHVIGYEDFGVFEYAGRSVAMMHGNNENRLMAAEQSGKYDLICYGHTHRAEWHQTGKTLVVNPGALFRSKPRTLALYHAGKHRVDIVPLM